MRTPTQKGRVLDALRKRRDTGVRPTDFIGPTCDGGEPILRVAARVHELIAEGYRIETLPGKVATYVLHETAGVVPSPPAPTGAPVGAGHRGDGREAGLRTPAPASAPPTLFPTPLPKRRPASPYDREAA